MKKIMPNTDTPTGLKDFRSLAIKKIFESQEDIGKNKLLFLNFTTRKHSLEHQQFLWGY